MCRHHGFMGHDKGRHPSTEAGKGGANLFGQASRTCVCVCACVCCMFHYHVPGQVARPSSPPQHAKDPVPEGFHTWLQTHCPHFSTAPALQDGEQHPGPAHSMPAAPPPPPAVTSQNVSRLLPRIPWLRTCSRESRKSCLVRNILNEITLQFTEKKPQSQ